MKFLIALAFVALATAVPMPAVPAPVQLPAPVAPQVFHGEPGFMAISIEPLIITPEVADEFFRSLAPVGVHEPAAEIKPVPVKVVDVAENVETIRQVAEEILPVKVVDSAIPPAVARVPPNSEAEVAAEEIVPTQVKFVDVAENAEVAPVSEVAAEEIAEVAEEIVPTPVKIVDVAENAEVAPLSEVAAEKIVPSPVKFVDVAENVAAPIQKSEVVAEDFKPTPVRVVEAPLKFDMASMMRSN